MKINALDVGIRILSIVGLMVLAHMIYSFWSFKDDEKNSQIASQERMSEPLHYEECHKHHTYGAHIGYVLYCMVPLDRMKELR